MLRRPAISPRWRMVMARALPLIASVAARHGRLFDVSTTKGHENHPVLFSKWNSFSRIGVYEQPYGAWSLSDKYTGPLPDTRLMDIDSAAGTQILKFGGDLKDVSYLQYELTALGYRLLRRARRAAPAPRSTRSSSAPAAGAICCRRWCSAPRASTASRSTRSSSTT